LKIAMPIRCLVIALLALSWCHMGLARGAMPQLEKQGDVLRLSVDGKPFLVLGGELGNSSAAGAEYMKPVWPRLKAMNLNTVLAPVYWELLEPREGEFEFSHVDDLIDAARAHDLKLIILWFGAWKNSMSSYAPAWVKLDQERFPRVRDDRGLSHEILTAFNDANLQADRKAFVRLMQHLKDYDGKQHTVIMVQVENEIGMLPTARDYHPLANKAFQAPVPAALTGYLDRQRTLVPEFAALWNVPGRARQGNWETVFGSGLHTDELFMAWYYAQFANELAAAGKAVYPLPMFVNAALPRPGRKPGSGYPSAGPLPHLMDIWKAGAPAIDFLSPDFYNPDFKHWNDLYTRQGNPLFIPEHKFDDTVAAKALFAFGHYEAIGFAPFSIENGSPEHGAALGKMYELIAQLTPVITRHHGQGRIEGVLFDKANPETVLRFGDYKFICRHDYTLGWSPGAAEASWPFAGAVIIQTGQNEFHVGGNGVVITFEPAASNTAKAGILTADEGIFKNGVWNPGRRLNGDQTHQGRHLRIPMEDYGIQRLELYTY
jgi:beta-galactosidase GanA